MVSLVGLTVKFLDVIASPVKVHLKLLDPGRDVTASLVKVFKPMSRPFFIFNFCDNATSSTRMQTLLPSVPVLC
jgi:hypothetical protein